MSLSSKKKIVYIVSDIQKSLAFEWISEELNKNKFDLSFILLGEKNTELYKFLVGNQIECFEVSTTSSKKSLPLAFFRVSLLLLKLHPGVVHTHLFIANIIGLTAAKILGIKKRIYTRHHSSFHHDFVPQAVKWDLMCNYLATDIIAITKNVADIVIRKEKVKPEKVQVIHHGFKLEKFRSVENSRLVALKEKYNMTSKRGPVLGVIARQIKWKGIQYIIPAFKNFLKDYPDSLLILANANGPDKVFIKEMLQKELPSDSYIQIKFESDLFALYQLFDMYIHVPVDPTIEAFGQTYVEALAAGIPSVFTLSGIACDFIQHEKNALVVDYKSSEEIYQAMKRIMEDDLLRKKLIENGLESTKNFELGQFIYQLEKAYE